MRLKRRYIGVIRSSDVYQPVNIAELADDGGRKNKGIEIGYPHAAVETVHREGQRQPCVDQLFDATGVVGIEVQRSDQFGAPAGRA